MLSETTFSRCVFAILLLWFSFVFFPLIFFMRNSCFLNSVNIPVPCNFY